MHYDTGMLFHSVFRAHHNATHGRMSRQGLGDVGSPRLLHVLRSFREKGESPSQKELADRLHLSPATVATSLKSLERNGYVEREMDPADCRRNRIALTDKAMEAMERADHVFFSVDRDMLDGFRKEEVDQLGDYLQRMLKNLYAIGGDREAPCVPPPPPEEAFNERKYETT